MFHCHMMYHEDQGMMGQFMVVEPGQKPDAVIGEGLANGVPHGSMTPSAGTSSATPTPGHSSGTHR